MELVRRLAAHAGALRRDEARDLEKACEVVKAVSKEALVELVASAGPVPMLQSCSADGTPMLVSHQLALQLPSGQVVRRGGKASLELLMAVQFTRLTRGNGATETVVVANDPRPLTNGKGVGRLFEAARCDWASLRQLGHRGGSIQHYVFDRAGFGKWTRRLAQWHSLVASSFDSDPERAEDLQRLEWIVQCVRRPRCP